MRKVKGMKAMVGSTMRKGWRSLAIAFMVCWVAIALNACNPNYFRTQTAQVSQIVARTPSDPKTFNFALLNSYPNVFTFTYLALVMENGKGEIEPSLAESWQISDDNLRYIFTLREGLKWSDGESLTVDDVVFTFNDVFFNPQIPTDFRDTFKIGEKGLLPKIRKLDDRRVEFILPEPFAPFLRTVGSGAIMPAHSLQASIFEKDADGNPKFVSTWGTDTDPTQVVVNGPYKIASYAPTQRVIFERNPYYWQKDEQGNPLPYLDRIVWQIVDSSDTALLQFRSGGLDVLDIGAVSFALLKREDKRGNFTIYNGGPDSSTLFISFNLNQGKRNGKPLIDPIKLRWFNTVEFRQAIAYALNRQAMNNNALRGLGELQNSPISVQSPYYLSPEQGLKVYDYNPEKARQLLTQAGFKYNANGQLLDADGNRVRFTLTANSGSRTTADIVGQIKRDLAGIGIQIDLQVVEFGTLVERLDNSLDLECFIIGFTGGIEPNQGSNLWLPDGGSHFFNLKPKPGQAPLEGRVVSNWETRIGEIFVQAARELDETRRKALYGEFQQITQEYLPLIYLVNPLSMSAVRNNIQNVELSSLYYEQSLWNVYQLRNTGS